MMAKILNVAGLRAACLTGALALAGCYNYSMSKPHVTDDSVAVSRATQVTLPVRMPEEFYFSVMASYQRVENPNQEFCEGVRGELDEFDLFAKDTVAFFVVADFHQNGRSIFRTVVMDMINQDPCTELRETRFVYPTSKLPLDLETAPIDVYLHPISIRELSFDSEFTGDLAKLVAEGTGLVLTGGASGAILSRAGGIESVVEENTDGLERIVNAYLKNQSKTKSHREPEFFRVEQPSGLPVGKNLEIAINVEKNRDGSTVESAHVGTLTLTSTIVPHQFAELDRVSFPSIEFDRISDQNIIHLTVSNRNVGERADFEEATEMARYVENSKDDEVTIGVEVKSIDFPSFEYSGLKDIFIGNSNDKKLYCDKLVEIVSGSDSWTAIEKAGLIYSPLKYWTEYDDLWIELNELKKFQPQSSWRVVNLETLRQANETHSKKLAEFANFVRGIPADNCLQSEIFIKEIWPKLGLGPDDVEAGYNRMSNYVSAVAGWIETVENAGNDGRPLLATITEDYLAVLFGHTSSAATLAERMRIGREDDTVLVSVSGHFRDKFVSDEVRTDWNWSSGENSGPVSASALLDWMKQHDDAATRFGCLSATGVDHKVVTFFQIAVPGSERQPTAFSVISRFSDETNGVLEEIEFRDLTLATRRDNASLFLAAANDEGCSRAPDNRRIEAGFNNSLAEDVGRSLRVTDLLNRLDESRS